LDTNSQKLDTTPTKERGNYRSYSRNDTTIGEEEGGKSARCWKQKIYRVLDKPKRKSVWI
jgi:hypothetical protein